MSNQAFLDWAHQITAVVQNLCDEKGNLADRNKLGELMGELHTEVIENEQQQGGAE